ncbi:MAG: DsrH/TusB family sulfur metabolism protein [Candidatus Jordarchaeaceae archaeon]
MKTLFFLTKKESDSLALVEKLKERGENVSVVLIQDAVYLALENNEHSGIIRDLLGKGVDFHVLAKDVELRGIQEHLIPDLDLIDYDQLTDLLFSENQRVINL